MNNPNPKLKVLDNPMQLIIDESIALGYAPIPDETKYAQCLHVKEWLAYRFNIYTWIVPQRDFTFIPYYKDLRDPRSHKKRYAFSECHMQAFVEGLLFAVKSIK